MPDKDLRKQALKSGKTTSKKSQRQSTESSRPTSRTPSAPNSRPSSRIASRNASDDEGEVSDDTSYSINSIDALLESDEFNELTTDSLKQELTDCIEELLERKGSSSKSREDSLIHYDRILASHQLGDVLYGRVEGLLAAFAKSIKADTTPKETTFALKAIALTAVSYESATLYDTVSSLLKRTITDTPDLSNKAAAIHALSICTSYGGAGESEINEQLTFLLEIIQSDGAFAGADDNAEVVAAALQAYAYLATYVDDLENESEDAIEAFLEQLDSSNAHVQIAAGEAIALLFEKSYTPREDDEDDEDDNHDQDSSDDADSGDTSLVKRYNAYHNPAEVLEKVSALSSLSTKTLSRHDKKKLHSSFSSITITVENPRLGLRTNSASRMVVRIHGEAEIKVDQWWKLMRLNTLRRLLGGGFINHYYEGNKQILNSLPVIVRSTAGGSGALSPRRTPRRPGDKYRDVRRFVAAEAI